MTERLSKYRKQFLEDWFDFNGKGMFFIICLTYLALLFVKRIFIIDTIAAFEVLNERGEIWVFDILFGIQYLSVPFFLAWKWTWTTLILWIGCFMFGYRLHFNQLWKMVMLAELVFFLPEIVKVLWFTLFYTDPDYNDYMAFYPFSLINLVDYTQIDPKYHYPLKSINLFELLYWPVLILGIYFMSGKKLKISSYIVLSTYILFFFVWLGFYMMVY
ncbi:MAG: sulfate ABC transporter permease [Ekhidna sp.]|nr:sulfate ABC transporter permease [Ekhidna sp.]